MKAKLPYFKNELIERENIAKKYKELIKNDIEIPIVKSNRTTSWGQYTIRVKNRDNFQKILKDKNIQLQFIILYLYIYRNVLNT